MSAMQLLEQLLKAKTGGGLPTGHSGSGAGSGWDTKSLLTGGAAGGALGLLLGTRRGRNIGGKALKIGSVAALGALAYHAYNRWQDSQRAAAPMPAPGAPAGPAPAPAPSFAALPAPQVEQHSQAMLKAMIAAAKSDGHMDERERGMVEAELQRLAADAPLRQWVEAELRKPIDPADVARSAGGPEQAAEVYLASVLVVDDTTPMERAYLDALATELKLAPGLKAELERQAAAATAGG